MRGACLAVAVAAVALLCPTAATAQPMGGVNRALVDARGTAEVRRQVVAVSEALLSYSTGDVDGYRARVRELTAGSLSTQLGTLARQVGAAGGGVVQTTTVSRVAVRSLDARSASAVVFAERRTGRAGTDLVRSTPTRFTVALVRDEGVWKATGIDLYGVR
ncbi:hypothetical protein BJP25_14135 [Actinokineospora bangkokensis]|uniref:Mce-associated membrane protein n=2 Tax=Actinokineospora bangkokensis TaxID=1193682 RepID=A0A1Q9LN54_9PSEU|nr:hypothetical protein BJP25_14135 [Actinokineospora bangkokensis]